MKTPRKIFNDKYGESFSNLTGALTESFIECCQNVSEEYAEQFQPKWIPVSERLPKAPDIVYLVAVKNKNKENGIPLIDIAVFDSDGIWQKSTVWEDVTHWMNLPEAP